MGAGLEKIDVRRPASKPWHSAPARSGLGVKKYAEFDGGDRFRLGPLPVKLQGAGGGRHRKNDCAREGPKFKLSAPARSGLGVKN